MDYIEDISFKTDHANHGGRKSVEDALNGMIPVLRTLTVVHRGSFIHRDMTPGDIYITKDDMVKLLDFGSVRYSIGHKSESLDVILGVVCAPGKQYIRHSSQSPCTRTSTPAPTAFYAAITGFLPPESLERLVGLTETSPGVIVLASFAPAVVEKLVLAAKPVSSGIYTCG